MTQSNQPMTVIPDLTDLIEVQPARTISHTPLAEAGARVVLFGFGTDEELSEHTAAVPVLLQVLSGRLSVTADDRTVELVPGGLVHLGARVPHSVTAEEPSILMLTLLDPRVKQ